MYRIEKPTAEFKKHFPKKYMSVTVGSAGVKKRFTDTMPPITRWTVGYIFTYDTKKIKVNQKPLDMTLMDPGNTFPGCLDMYFTKGIDLVISCMNKDKSVSPLMLTDMIIRCNSSKLAGVEDWKNVPKETNKFITKHIKHGVAMILEKVFDKQINIMKWVTLVLDTFPMNVYGLPVKFPDELKDGEKFPIEIDNLFIEYDFRAKSEDHEKRFIKHMEETFEDEDYVVNLTNSYTNFLPKVIELLKAAGVSYKEIHKNTISLKWKDLKKIEYEFQITDFI
jgi:hypothetical protein